MHDLNRDTYRMESLLFCLLWYSTRFVALPILSSPFTSSLLLCPNVLVLFSLHYFWLDLFTWIMWSSHYLRNNSADAMCSCYFFILFIVLRKIAHLLHFNIQNIYNLSNGKFTPLNLPSNILILFNVHTSNAHLNQRHLWIFSLIYFAFMIVPVLFPLWYIRILSPSLLTGDCLAILALCSEFVVSAAMKLIGLIQSTQIHI